MKCRSRSTLGIVIGWLGIFLSTFGITFGVIGIDLRIKIQQHWHKNDETIAVRSNFFGSMENIILLGLIILSVPTVIVSGSLIKGIHERRHSLMVPWLVLSVVLLVIGCMWTLFLFFAVILAETFSSLIFYGFVFCIPILVLQDFITHKIYTLYRDMKTMNNGYPSQIASGNDVDLTGPYSDLPYNYTTVSQKG